MSDNGYVYAYRTAWTHPAFNNLREAAIWNFLYQNAFWEDGERNFNGHTFLLKRGQIAVSVKFLAEGFCMTEKGARLVIQKLEKLGMIVKQGANKGTIITICNYEKYQVSKKTKGEQKGKPRANKGQTKGENNKKVSNEGIKEDKKDIGDFILPLPEWLPLDYWNQYLEMRIKKNKAASNLAKQQTIIKLDELRKKGQDPSAILRESIINGWTSVFEIKGNRNENIIGSNGNYTGKYQSTAGGVDKHQRTLEAAARGHMRAENPDF